jgi:hypothetical protein
MRIALAFAALIASAPLAHAQSVSSQSFRPGGAGGVSSLTITLSDGTKHTTTATRNEFGQITLDTKESAATYDPGGRGFPDAKRTRCSSGEC